jgi:uncharacterized short protein YbdD (DUF466 family)
MAKARRVLWRIWEMVREVFGDKAYDRYAEHIRTHGGEPLTREEFYVSQLQRKYTRPSRCC